MTLKEEPCCAVVEKSGKYMVVNGVDVRDGQLAGWKFELVNGSYKLVGSHIVPPGQYYGKPHLLITGASDVTEAVLKETIETRINELNGQVASNRGWTLPKLETLTEKIRTLPFVAGVSIHR